jgi:hypothetical protein
MTILVQQKNSYITPRFMVMSPYEVYLSQIKAAIENIRFTAQGMSYTPAQLGGLDGQLNTLTQEVVLQVTDYQVNS